MDKKNEQFNEIKKVSIPIYYNCKKVTITHESYLYNGIIFTIVTRKKSTKNNKNTNRIQKSKQKR